MNTHANAKYFSTPDTNVIIACSNPVYNYLVGSQDIREDIIINYIIE
jgi:hypothetical protein